MARVNHDMASAAGTARDRVIAARFPGQPFLFGSVRAPNKEFSNFYKVKLVVDGVTYATAEAIFQAQKFANTDPAYARVVAAAKSGTEAARLGRSRAHTLEPGWDGAPSQRAMLKALRAKFHERNHPEMVALLLATGTRDIVEDATWDANWGIGADGEGANRLGLLLMRVRKELQDRGVKISMLPRAEAKAKAKAKPKAVSANRVAVNAALAAFTRGDRAPRAVPNTPLPAAYVGAGDIGDCEVGAELQFFSRSKCAPAQYLSNFQVLTTPLVMTWHKAPLRFASVEHAFHAKKFILAQGTGVPTPVDFGVNGVFGQLSPGALKLLGGAPTFRAMGWKLDVKTWNRVRAVHMLRLLRARMSVDALFRTYLLWALRRRVTLVHFERGSAKRPPFWGRVKAGVGANMLGRAMRKAARMWVQKRDRGALQRAVQPAALWRRHPVV